MLLSTYVLSLCFISQFTGTKRAVSRTKSDGGKHGSGDKLPTVSGASPPSASNSEGMDGVSVRGSSVNASATKTADDDVDKVENRCFIFIRVKY